MLNSPRDQPLRVAIAGATGFVGNALVSGLANECTVIALGRRYAPSLTATSPGRLSVPGIVRRRCDLFSIRQTRSALENAEIAVYLVHSMSQDARLTQGCSEDLDLLLADNFGRAAAESGVRRIVYLGELLPSDEDAALSPHLASRLEVEKALGAQGVPVTALRAGLIVAAEGASLNILVRLVERLPLMLCPSWTSSRTQPIALSDVIEILSYCCRDEETAGRVCEIGGPDVLSYRDMMRVTAKVVGRRRRMIPLPFVMSVLAERWVSRVTGTSRSLVRLLIESLRRPMVVSNPWLQEKMGLRGRSFEGALRDSLCQSRIWKRPIVRSVQRFRLPPDRDAAWVGEEYPRWLQRVLPGLLRVDREGAELRLGIRGIRRPMLVLEREETSDESERYMLRVVGGLLAEAHPQGDPRLEFRMTPDGSQVLAALQDFEPRLPWWIYACTQAPIHAGIMSAYRRFLSKAI